MLKILVATGDAATARLLGRSLAAKGRVDTVTQRAALDEAVARKPYDFAFVDLDILSGPGNGAVCRESLQALWRTAPSLHVVVMTGAERIRHAVDAVKAGASNYLTFPLNPVEVEYVLESVQDMATMESELRYLRDSMGRVVSTLITESASPAMRATLERIRTVASTRTLVLLTGESGTGKSVFARYIHDMSARSNRQFISVHCGAIPDTLLESEFFGHEKGAFTGAVRRKLGKFELADGGTLFLDEIGTITPAAQVKLLQVLQEHTFQRVGGEATLTTDARIIASTNGDLKAMVQDRTFRQDLYYRLNVFPIEIPALRERKEDIPLLVAAFLDKLGRNYGKAIHGAHPTVLEAFERYDWPGNVRELENLVERAYILETSHLLTPESFPADMFSGASPAATIPLDTSLSLAEFRDRAKENAERHYLKEILAACNGRINRTAERAGITTRQLHKLLTRYGIDKREYR
ncbi:MAG: sigma-54-dependent Fis family transcriptional regulator [Desulfovibrionaceae bacterium]|jgi:DNA-binding NtrC family response regulator|nr:sigma-54-dependent Fis family transcriptional regulator [Desulfovibrionaceae bacterium]